jgi:hypothetical protein
MSVIIQHKRGTASQWTSLNPTLDAGEVGWESDTNKFKIGTGSTAWNSLGYATLTPSGLSATYAQLVGGNAFTGAQTITSTATGQFPLTIIPATGQTAETFRIRNSANNADLLNISSGGSLTINAAAGSTPYMNLPGLVTLGRQADNEINIRNLSQLRFESGNNWNYNSWAGLGFDSSNRNLYLGGPAGSANYFRNNNNAERVIFNLVGLSTSNSDAKDTILQSRGTNTRLIVRGKNQTATVSGVTGNGTTVTYTTSSAHYMDAGDVVTITGVNPSGYNLTSVAIASVPSQTTFTVTNAATGTFVSGGTATVNQANNLQEWQNSAGSILSRINSAGDLFTDRVNLGGAVFGGGTYYGKLNILQEAGGHGITIQGRDSQTTDLLRIRMGATPGAGNDAILIQNSGGTTLTNVSSNGSLTAPSLTISGGGTYTTGSIFADSNWGMIFRSRTASPTNAQYRWANSADGELMRLDNSGRLIVSNSFSGSTQGTAQIEARTVNATTVGAIVRGFGTGGSYTQTADLQQWQSFDGTTATTVAQLLSTGAFVSAGAIRATGPIGSSSIGLGGIVSNAAGGHVVMQNAGASPNQPSGGGVLFVESGALRYRGTSNASQTIANADGTSPFAILANNNSFLGRIFLSGGATIYDHVVETPGSTDTAWKKLIEVTCPTGLFTGASYELEVVDSFDNYGIVDRVAQRFRFYVKITRSGGTQDDVLAASVTGPSTNYVRVVKTSSSLYEIQVRQPDVFRIISFKARRVGHNNTTESYTPSGRTYGTLDAGSTTGTIYLPVNDSTTVANFLVDNFSQVSSNRMTIQPLGTLATTTPLLTLTGSSTQNSNYVEVRNSGGTILSRTSSDGSWNQGPDSTRTFVSAASGRIQVVSSNSTAPGIVLRPFAANYAGYDHMQYRNSADGIIGGINVNGQLYSGSTAALTTGTGGATTTTSGTGTVATITTTSIHNLSTGDRVTVAGVTPTGYNGTFIVTGTPTTTSFTYNNTTTGSQTVAGTVSIDAQASIVARSAATTPLILRAATNQGVNMFRIEGSAGGATATIDAAGAASFVSGAVVLTGGGSVSANGTVNSAGSMRIGSTGATLSGTNILYMASGTAPSASPISGGFLHVDSGALRYRGTSNPSTTIVNADGTIPIFSANNTFTGVQAFNNTVNIGSGVSGSVGLEIGSTNGTATTPFIDFHSGATATDFDSRIIASGGTGTNGAGTLTYTAATNTFTGTVTATSLIRSGGTSAQFLKANGDVDSNTYLPTTSSYFAGHNPEGRLMYNTYLTNDMANARLRGSAVAATQNGSAYTISNANWDAMFDGTASFFNISPVSGFTFPLVMTIPLPRTLTYGTWVGLSFGSTTFRANSVQIEVFSLDSNSWVTVVNTTTNTSEDIFTSVSGLTNGNATGINQIRYTISNPNSTQLRIAHLWAYNFNSDMWSQTMMPRGGGSFYGPVTNITTNTASVPLTVKGASGQTSNIFEVQTNASTLLSAVTPAGRLYVQRQEGIQFMDGAATLRSRIYSSGNNGIYFDTGGGNVRVLTLDGGSEAITGNLINPYSTGRSGLIIRGLSGQSGDLLEVQNDGATDLFAVAASGQITAKVVANAANQNRGIMLSNTADTWQSGVYLRSDGSGNPRLSLLAPTGGLGEAVSIDAAAKVGFNNIAPTGQVDITTASTTRVPLIIRPQASQTADLLQVRNSADSANLAKITSSGDAQFGAIALGNGTIYGSASFLNIASTSAGQIGAIIRASSTQSTDQIQYQSSAGTVLGGRNGVGQIYSGSTQPINYQVGGTPTATSGTGSVATITLTSASNLAVGDLIQVTGFTPTGYNTTGYAVVSAVSNSSPFTVSYASTGTGTMTIAGQVQTASQTSITARSAGTIPLIVRGAASQVNLQNWQNSSGQNVVIINAFGSLVGSSSANQFNSDNGANFILRTAGTADQRGNHYQVVNSSSTILAGFNGQGQIFTGATAPIQGSTTVAIGTQTPSGTTNITITTGSNHGILVGQTVVIAGVTPTGYNGTWTAQSGTTGTTLIVNIGSNPGVITGAGVVSQNSQLGVVASSANNTPVVIRGVASQVANLTEWRDSGGNNVGLVTAGGTIQMANVVSNAAMRANGSLATSSVAAISIVSNATIGHLVLQNIGTVPNQPSGGGVLYVESGALRYRGTSNAAVTIVNADGTISLSNPLLTSISTVGGGGSEGGQINFARVTDGAQYWFIDSFGTTSSPDLRFVENATERFRLVAGGAISLGGQTGASGQLLASAGGSSSPTWRNGPVDATTTTATTGFGFMGLPQNATTTGSYTLVAADAGKHIFASATRTVTIPANGSVGFPVGTTITFIAGLGATMTIAITTDTMYLAGAGTTGSRTLAAHGIATAVKTTSTTWLISGNGLT